MSELEELRPPQAKFWTTLRFRFALWTAGLLLIVLVGFAAFVLFLMKRSLDASITESLSINAAQALNVVEVDNGVIELPASFVEGTDADELRGQGFMLRTLASDGSVLRIVGSYPTLPVSVEAVAAARQGETHLASVTDQATGEVFRVYTVPIESDEVMVGIYQVGVALTEVNETLAGLVRTFLVAGPLVVAIAGVGGYLLAARALAPIEDITRTARRISAEDLSARIAPAVTADEVGRLAGTFNAMLERLEKAFERERQFTADASHELRTPLAAMQAILDVTRERPRSVEEYKSALTDVDAENKRLIGIAEGLLLLVRTEGTDRRAYEQIDLSQLVVDVTDSLRPLALKKGLRLVCECDEQVEIYADADELIRLTANLIDNAIKYSDAGQITVTVDHATADRVSIEVRDQGIGIPGGDLPHIFERFYRADPSRTSDGVGLGLSIAQRIAHSYEGNIGVQSELGKGSTFTVHLPGS